MQARYYDPVIGRFLSNDPVGFAEGGAGFFNRYAYTANDPVNHWDPNGESRIRLGASGKLGAAIGVRLGAEVSFDLVSLEIGAKFQLGVSGGAEIGGGTTLSIEPSEELGTFNRQTLEAGGDVRVAGSIGPVGGAAGVRNMETHTFNQTFTPGEGYNQRTYQSETLQGPYREFGPEAVNVLNPSLASAEVSATVSATATLESNFSLKDTFEHITSLLKE